MHKVKLATCLVMVAGLALGALSPWVPGPPTYPGGAQSYMSLTNGWSIAFQKGGDDSGRLHIAYEKYDVIYYRHSDDTARTWSPAQTVSDGSATREMPVLACRNDTLTVAWPELIGAEWHIKQRTNRNGGGGEWDNIKVTTDDEPNAFWNVCPSIAMWSNDDNDHVLKTSIAYTCSLSTTPRTCDAYHTHRIRLASWHEEDMYESKTTDSSAMMVSVSGRWDDNDGHFGFQRMDGADGDWEVWYAQGWEGTDGHSLLKLTHNTCAKADDKWPSVQAFRQISTGDSLAAVAYYTDSAPF
jgi:hypothetical protein